MQMNKRDNCDKIPRMDRILVTRSSMPTLDEYIEEIKPMFESHWLTNMGPKHEQLREELKEYLKVEGIQLLTNGHMALEMTLQAMELKGEVITTPFTFASTTHAIKRAGLKPVFCDIKEDDYTIDPDKIESLINENTSAIMPVHVYGNICDVEKIADIANKYNLKVIYDAAHTFGIDYKGKGIGTYGDASIFSFHATKVYNTVEGGAVTSADAQLLDSIYYYKDFGIYDEETVISVGANAKFNEFCAAMGICNLRHVDSEIAKRKAVVEKYRSLLGDVNGIKLCPINPDVKQNYAYFPVVFQDDFKFSRDEVFENLKRYNIGARKYFYPLTNSMDCYKNDYDVNETPVALEISKRVLTLPLFADLKLESVEKICQIIINGDL